MIVADTSAIVAIAFAEPEREPFVNILHRAERVLISAVSVVEARMAVQGRRGQRAVVLVDDLMRLSLFEVVPPGPAEMDAAYAAFVAHTPDVLVTDLSMAGCGGLEGKPQLAHQVEHELHGLALEVAEVIVAILAGLLVHRRGPRC